ncbi:MAG TPA: hypothetical protein VMY35_16755 [Phycisphaerae bacterium]|nr:hypothetical protein [Phycisphaerae bacterium]
MKSMLLVAAALVLVFSGPAWTAEGPGPEPADEAIHRLEAEVRMLRATVASLVKENAALKAEVAAPQIGTTAPIPVPVEKDKAPEPQKIVRFYEPKDFVVGAVGRFHLAVRVEQMLGPTAAVYSMPVYEPSGYANRPPVLRGRWRFLLQDFPTAGLVDGMDRPLDTVFVVRGTRTLDLATGGTETVFVLAPAAPTAAP